MFGHRIVRTFVAALALTLGAGAAYAGPGLRAGQKDQLKALAAETRERMDRARDELRRAHMDLAVVFGSYQLDLRKAKAAQERLSKAQFDLLKAHLDNQLQIRRVMNADQFEQFTSMMRQRMQGGPPGKFRHMDESGPDFFPDGKLLRSLNLDDDQIRRLKSVMGPDRRKSIEKLESDTRQLIQMYERYDLDATAARKLIDSVHSTQISLAALHLKSQQTLRSVLTQAQFESYRDALAQRMRERMRDHGWRERRMRP